MIAIVALQGALVVCLEQERLLSGVFLDAPARAQFPYAVLNCSDERDWSCKGRNGREIALQLELWDEQPSRLLEVESAIEQRLRDVIIPKQWHLSTLLLTGKKRVRSPGSPWSCVFEMRARLIATDASA
jgi:hypothetical protein